MSRLIAEVVILVLIVALIGALAFVALLRRGSKPAPEIDSSRIPADWFANSRDIGGRTEISIQLVARKDGTVLERRVRKVIDNADPDYDARFDSEMEKAYQASIDAQTYRSRR